MAPPWQTPKARRRLPGGVTGNALLTGIISAIVAGVIAFYVAHWQSQDAARQAIANQQLQEVIRLEADARTFDQAAASAYVSAWQCAHKTTSACAEADAAGAVNGPLTSAQDALLTDMNNVSDSAVRTDTEKLVDQVTGALQEEGSERGTAYWWDAGSAYSNLLFRCGQLIQGG